MRERERERERERGGGERESEREREREGGERESDRESRVICVNLYSQKPSTQETLEQTVHNLRLMRAYNSLEFPVITRVIRDR